MASYFCNGVSQTKYSLLPRCISVTAAADCTGCTILFSLAWENQCVCWRSGYIIKMVLLLPTKWLPAMRFGTWRGLTCRQACRRGSAGSLPACLPGPAGWRRCSLCPSCPARWRHWRLCPPCPAGCRWWRLCHAWSVPCWAWWWRWWIYPSCPPWWRGWGLCPVWGVQCPVWWWRWRLYPTTSPPPSWWSNKSCRSVRVSGSLSEVDSKLHMQPMGTWRY